MPICRQPVSIHMSHVSARTEQSDLTALVKADDDLPLILVALFQCKQVLKPY